MSEAEQQAYLAETQKLRRRISDGERTELSFSWTFDFQGNSPKTKLSMDLKIKIYWFEKEFPN